MKIEASSPEDYLAQLPEGRKDAMKKLRETLLKNLPEGFEETMGYGMIAYVVPLSHYPQGYHVDRNLPLPFINIASQKGHIALYHMGLYTDKDLLEWFTAEYSKNYKAKLDMGKSCIRFKNPEKIPFPLIAKLAQKISPKEWIGMYETASNR